MPEIIDDKSEHCVPFILDRIASHREQYTSKGETPTPFFVGLNGVQGAGKTTLCFHKLSRGIGPTEECLSSGNLDIKIAETAEVETLSKTLSSAPHNLPTLVFSIDDLYLPHDQQEELAKSQPSNPLVQHRGQPSTHDVKLGKETFAAIASRKSDIKVPSYDKSAFNGAGDRRPESEWETCNRKGEPPVEVVIFEGWCVGFRALSDEDVERKWKAAVDEFQAKGEAYTGRLGRLQLDSVLFVNNKLRDYDDMTSQLGAFVHIDAADPLYVYDWRQQQESAMRVSKGTGMSEEQVNNFVNGYYPAYELYTEVLRNGIYPEKGRQLRLVVEKSRRVKEVHRL